MKEATPGMEQKKDAPPPDGDPRRPVKSSKESYRTPTLTEYGPVQRLTGTGGTIDLADGGQSMRMPAGCL
jgi:hypothetical protein